MKTILTTFVIMALTFAFHELGHALAAKMLGYDVRLNINSVNLADGAAYEEKGHRIVVKIAGPLVTLVIGLLAAVIARVTGSMTALWVVFAAFMMRLIAQAISLSNPNDEMRVSEALGIGAWTLPIVMMIVLLGILTWAARGPKAGPLHFVLASIGVGAGVSAVVFAEPYIPALTF